MEAYFIDGRVVQSVCKNIIHPSQYGFIAGRKILHNVLNVQMATDYTQQTHQEMVMVQLDLEKSI